MSTGAEARPLLGVDHPLIGMVHVAALPATPRARLSVSALVAQAAAEARDLAAGGVDAVLIENMHDLPYLKGQVGPEIVAAMTAVGVAVRAAMDLPLGVQVLAGANHEALAVALACEAAFVRVEGFAYAHVADEGLMETAAAGPLLRYRRAIGAEQVAIWADVKKKHASHSITADLDLAETAHGAEFAGADALVVTGSSTGVATASDDLATARGGCALPVLVGSGTAVDGLAAQWPVADGFIVGSALKQEGSWQNPVEPARVRAFADAVRRLRER